MWLQSVQKPGFGSGLGWGLGSALPSLQVHDSRRPKLTKAPPNAPAERLRKHGRAQNRVNAQERVKEMVQVGALVALRAAMLRQCCALRGLACDSRFFCTGWVFPLSRCPGKIFIARCKKSGLNEAWGGAWDRPRQARKCMTSTTRDDRNSRPMQQRSACESTAAPVTI